MKSVLLIFLIISFNNTVSGENSRQNNSVKRKLLSYMGKDANVTWSELLATVFINNVNIFKGKTNEIEIETLPTENFLTKVFSSVFQIFKTYVYDKLKRNVNVLSSENINTDLKEDKRVYKASNNPKEDVEIIEPQYHGKLCTNCDTTDIEVGSACPEDYIKDSNGDCIEVKPSKFILSVPNQCPFGYKPDWLGYCRESF